MVASGSRRMSMAVISFGSALAAAGSVVWAVARPVPRASIARAHAIAPVSRMFLTFVFMVVFFLVVSVSGQLDEFSKAKIFFQSFFMLITIQPSFFASS